MMYGFLKKHLPFRKTISVLVVLIVISCQSDKTRNTYKNKSRGFIAEKAMVVSAHPLASKVGVDILKRGGNAIDAAIAVQFALAVVHPSAGNIGGGGFMVIRENNGKTYTLDFREKAPMKADRNMYLDSYGNVIKDLSRNGHLSSGVPGTVDGMLKAYDKFSTMEWKDLLQPAIDLAYNGFALTRIEASGLNNNRDIFIEVNTIQPAITLIEHWDPGDTINYPDLAKTLTRIQEHGREDFYQGETANMIVAEMQRGGGLITHDDLDNYQSVWRKPVIGHYRKHKIISMGPPSSGGIALIQILQMLEQFPVSSYNMNSSEYIHLLAEAEKRVYADRARYLGDDEYFDVPQEELLDTAYNHKRMMDFSFEKVKPSEDIYAGILFSEESMETTHFSIIDQYGNAVAVTTTLNGGYGSKVFVAGAGFLMNNEMDDFSIKPGTPNMYGLTGGEANAIEPGKRMLSSMTPTIIEKEGKLFMVTGSPGGSRIITSVLQSILNVIEFDLTMQESVAYKRFHHQWNPDHIVFERGRMNDEVKEELLVKGHKLTVRGPYSRVDAILVLEDGILEGGADPRGDDVALGY
jgi:gamma-glutamyltranspeptidase/glutathione hydrolase